MANIEVNKGEWKVISDPDVSLCANNLGSSIAVAVIDMNKKCIGLLVSPFLKQSIIEELDKEDSICAIDIGLKDMFKEIMNFGCKKEQLKTYLIGGAQFLQAPKILSIGNTLYITVKKILEKNNLTIIGEMVGGPVNRSFSFNISGKLVVKSAFSQEVAL